jgi:RNA polymerase sigma factor (sigma-70 family)
VAAALLAARALWKGLRRRPREPIRALRAIRNMALLSGDARRATAAGSTASDAAAMAAAVRDPDAFADVFERHHDAIHRHLARRLGVDMADELAAEAFAVAFDKRARYDARFADARPWLFGIATRLAHRHCRREARELRAYARTGLDPTVPAADEGPADARVAAPALAAALAVLSPDDRDVLLLHAWEDLTHSEIALALSIPEGTVKSRLHRARRRVRAALAQAGALELSKEETDERA